MKKTFISLFLLSLLTVFGSLPLQADDELSFVYTTWGYDNSGDHKEYYCNGNVAENTKWISDGDFNWNQSIDNVAQREVSSVKWTGVDQAQACTRSDVSFSAANYTLTLLTYRTNHSATMTLPSISINGGDPIYASEARWGVSSTETIESNQFNYTNDNGKGAFETEVRLIYHTKINVANSYGISVSFPSGYDRFKDYVKTLTISQDAPTYAVSATASNGTVSGTGSYTEGAEVTLTASPNENYSFTGWSSIDISIADASANPLVFSMPSKAVSVTATFAECTKHMVTLTAGANGSVSGGGEQCDGSVTVNATPNTGYRFVNWTNTLTSAEVSTNAVYTFDLSADIGLTANFEEDPCLSSLTIEVEGNYAASGDYSGATYPSNIEFVAKNADGNDYQKSCHGSGYVNFKGSEWAEILIPVNIPVSGTYQVKAYAGEKKNMHIRIYATTSTEQGSITYKSTTYYRQTEKLINDGNTSETFVESDYTDAVALPTGICLVGLQAEWSWSAWDQITITRTDGTAFCPNTFTYTTIGSGSITCATASNSSVLGGTTIEMTAVPSGDDVFTGWTATAGSFSDPYALKTTFTMPADEDAEVTATFAQVNNVISQGSETGSNNGNSGGSASIAESHIADFDAFNHNVVKLTYSNMSGSTAYCGWNIGKSGSYNSASSAGATGFGFYYKTEAADDAVAMWFDPNTGNRDDQRGMQLAATENVWKYVYIEHAVANGWNRDNIIIYINGDQDSKTTAKASGAIYIADIAATSIISKDDIDEYHYRNDRGGAMQVGEYGTLCLPMGGTIDGATLYSVAGKETGDISYLVLEDQGTTVVAGKPYITQSTATPYTVTMSGAHSNLQDGNGLVGTYELINPLTPYNESGPYNYVLNENAFKKAGDNVTVGAYRAYLNWGAVSDAPAPAQSARRIRMAIEGKEVQTGMETVTAMPKTTKVLIDGQLFIIREGKRYTLTGARAQ